MAAVKSRKKITRVLEGNASITHEVAGKNHQKPLPDDAWIRSLIMKSGIGHIPVQQQTPAGKGLIAPAWRQINSVQTSQWHTLRHLQGWIW
jgi:hypothetical protein